MNTAQVTTQTLSVAQTRQRLDELLTRTAQGGTRVLVEDRGAPVGAIVSPDDLERLNQRDRERAERFKVIDELRAAFRGISSEELEREAARAIAEGRAERRAERARGLFRIRKLTFDRPAPTRD